MHLTAKLGPLLRQASRQHDLLSTADLRAAGFDRRQIGRLVFDGVLERIVQGLYRVGGTQTPLQDVAAAVSRHRVAAASHITGLWVHGFEVGFAPRPHLTLPPGSTSRTSLGHLHRSQLPAEHVSMVAGIRVTTIDRSLVDAAAQLKPDRLHRLVAAAVADRRVSIASISAVLERVESEPGRVGSGTVRSVLGTWTAALVPESPAEAAAIRRIVDFGLPAPETQYELRDPSGAFVARLDLAWPDFRVGREYDSDRFHDPSRAEQDERRRRRIEAQGWSLGVIHRGHLLPSREDWLHFLARQLRSTAA